MTKGLRPVGVLARHGWSGAAAARGIEENAADMPNTIGGLCRGELQGQAARLGLAVPELEEGEDILLVNARLLEFNPDELLAENFVFADVRPGEYTLYVKLQGVEYRQPVQVVEGALTTVELITEPYKTPTPTPEASPTPEETDMTPTAVPSQDD